MRQISNRYLLFALILSAVLLIPFVSVKANQTTEHLIRNIIERQISAFKAENAAKAFSYAAKKLQTHFENPEKFIEMVKQHYRPVFKPAWYRFGRFEVQDGTPIQAVMIQGEAGFIWLAVYRFDQQSDQKWKITGVSLHKLKGSGA